MKRLSALLLSAVLLISATACTSTSKTGTDETKPTPAAGTATATAAAAETSAATENKAVNELVYSMGTKPNLDPHWNAGSTGAYLQSIMYEGLYNYTETGFTLAGAESVDKSADGLTWTFHLRKDAKWNDGKPVVASNYVDSFRRLVDPKVSSVYMNAYGIFLKNGAKISAGELAVDQLGTTAIDDNTLEVKLEAVCPFFDALLCYSTFYPIRSDVVAEDGTGNWAWDASKSITNGPMKMTSCNEEQEIVLEKNPNYWNAAQVKLDKLDVKLVDDDNTRLSLFSTGAVDMISSVPSEERVSLQKQGVYHTIPALASSFLLVNNEADAIRDPKVRQALSMTIDRKFLSETLLNGTKLPADTFIGKGFPGSTADKDFHAEGGPLLTYDVEQAKKLLADAGYPEGKGFPVLEMKYSNSSPDNVVLFEYLQSIWQEQLGITTTLTPVEPATMTELRDAGKFDITVQGWGADYFDASNMLAIFAPGNLINAGKYKNDAFMAAYNASLTEVDNTKRIQNLHDAEKILVQQDMGIIPLYHSTKPYVFNESVVTNVKYDANGQMMLTDVIVKK